MRHDGEGGKKNKGRDFFRSHAEFLKANWIYGRTMQIHIAKYGRDEVKMSNWSKCSREAETELAAVSVLIRILAQC